MKVEKTNWMQLEAYLKHDDRAILPLGSTEQHGYLSLSVDSILSKRVALEAAEPVNIPVFPVVPYGLTPYFAAYPGSITLRVQTYVSLIKDILDGLAASGFKRIMLVNGHGGNSLAHAVAIEWMMDNCDVRIKFHNWWSAPKTIAKVKEIDTAYSHASWMENFPWTRLPGIDVPSEQKPMTDLDILKQLDPGRTRQRLGDGNYGGFYQRPDEDMLAIWDVAVKETREVLERPWE